MERVNLQVPYKHYEVFPTIDYGWLSACDALEEAVRKGYDEGF